MSSATHNTIFVAGAAGAIGRPLCRLLVQDGWRVVGTTRSPEKAEILRILGVEPVIVDVFDEQRLHAVVTNARPTVVIHQLTDLPPALDPTQMAAAVSRNARLREIGTRNRVAAAVASGVERMVAQSIAFAYAPGPLPYREDSSLNVNAPDEAGGLTARGVASLEQQVLSAPLVGIVLRYGQLISTLPGHESAETDAGFQLNAADLLPATQTAYHYSGSLTTPPCTEGVNWFVLTTPVSLSTDQITALEKVFSGNNRPVQAQS